MKVYSLIIWLLGLLLVPAAQSEQDKVLEQEPPLCGRMELLWQMADKVGMGPLYLGMQLQEAQSAGQLVPSKPSKYALCGVANARFMMDDGAIDVIFDKQQRIISLKSRAVDDACSVAQQMTQASAIFSDMQRLPLPHMPAKAEVSAAYFRIGAPPKAWLMLAPEFTQLDNGSCADAGTKKAPVSAFH
ncbi:hypothetical protein HR45_14350 [Shewanella mangrovi]|uniref:Uncharacterized protein n=1 Tax=Shewanella mangrovi TaxID=1515746 RepID=A0A094JWH0_9GAMM|nr:hypothetical protein [Shewanella mangrovi]KFZ36796.1 hypothetical protein HR45_14350 [Shewanella mangrovi]